MNWSEFALRIIFLFIPGLIAFNIVANLTFHKEFKTPDILLGSLTYGFISYLVYYLVFILLLSEKLSLFKWDFYFANDLTNFNTQLNFKEIGIATGCAIPVGLLVSYLINSKLLYKVANVLNISDKLDDLGVWNRAFEVSLNNWIIIRDIENDLMYQGWIESFSEGIEDKEILLRDVDVYINSDGQLSYSISAMYISLKKEDSIRVEFPNWKSTTDSKNA